MHRHSRTGRGLIVAASLACVALVSTLAAQAPAGAARTGKPNAADRRRRQHE
jgi:hypothetical protein